jgi:hypothetical protein
VGGGVTNLQPHEQTAKGDVGRQPTRSFNSQIIALDSTKIETMRVIKYGTLLHSTSQYIRQCLTFLSWTVRMCEKIESEIAIVYVRS